MPRSKLYLAHVFISAVFMFILAGALYLSRDFIRDAFLNPQNFFNIALSPDNLRMNIFFICLVIIVLLLSFVFYLFLTFNTRAELRTREATKSLLFSKEQFEWLYENAPVPYMMLDKDASIGKPNKSTLRFFEVVAEEIDNKNLFSYVAPEDREQAEKLFQYYKSNISMNRKELRMVTKSEGEKTVLLSIFRVKNPGDPKNVGLAMIFDVTEQKFLDKQKSEFVSLASHQLKTPLATAKWYTEMLASGDIGELSAKQKEYVNKLSEANKQMIDLVDTLLNVSRIEMGTLNIDKKPTNVEEISDSVLSELSVEIGRKKIRVDRQYNGNLKSVKTDPKLLRIAIQNLIGNAVKYTPKEGSISVIFEESLFGGEKIIVSDTGVGIPKNTQDKIFTKMFRADNVRRLEDVSGTGLGLYLVKSIMNSMGGDISFTSEENKGSVFTIKI